jgi:hypothetical protein
VSEASEASLESEASEASLVSEASEASLESEASEASLESTGSESTEVHPTAIKLRVKPSIRKRGKGRRVMGELLFNKLKPLFIGF